jgi:hypothetical protein
MEFKGQIAGGERRPRLNYPQDFSNASFQHGQRVRRGSSGMWHASVRSGGACPIPSCKAGTRIQSAHRDLLEGSFPTLYALGLSRTCERESFLESPSVGRWDLIIVARRAMVAAPESWLTERPAIAGTSAKHVSRRTYTTVLCDHIACSSSFRIEDRTEIDAGHRKKAGSGSRLPGRIGTQTIERGTGCQ